MRYVVTARRCEPRPAAVAKAAAKAAARACEDTGRGDRSRLSGRQQAASAESSGGSREGGGGRALRPGYVEVPQEEWDSLKEQLAVVPALTEQLQIMTRQHEQLLALLTKQQAEGGGAA
jgi:hypothetical protein